jgi:raffinose/stachyose/melibiose transport system permease protein
MIVQRRTVLVTVSELLVMIVALMFLAPFYFVLINSVKPFGEILTNAASIPKVFAWENYATVTRKIHFPLILFNSTLITIVSTALLVILGAMTSWWMVRQKTWFGRILFYAFTAAMVIPFQSIMIPFMKVVTATRIINTRIGLIIVYLGYSTPFTVFLYHGFMKSVSLEIEEAAIIDGCNTFQLFFTIVMPLIRSMTVTVIILQTLLIWNDFLLPLLMLNNRNLHTIPLAVFTFFGQYTNRWDYALATLVLGMTPIVVFFLIMQKHVVAGISAGSVKG